MLYLCNKEGRSGVKFRGDRDGNFKIFSSNKNQDNWTEQILNIYKLLEQQSCYKNYFICFNKSALTGKLPLAKLS